MHDGQWQCFCLRFLKGCRFTDFRPVLFVAKWHTANSSQISHLCRLFFWQYFFSRHLWFMTTGEDRRKDRFNNWKLCVLSKLPFRHYGAIKLTQNCVYFTNPCINPTVPTFLTRREYHPKLLERLHMLQCSSTHLQKTLPWAQARRQDVAAGGPKTRWGATYLKYCVRCMQQPGGQT